VLLVWRALYDYMYNDTAMMADLGDHLMSHLKQLFSLSDCQGHSLATVTVVVGQPLTGS
jgi:hypothetical protein